MTSNLSSAPAPLPDAGRDLDPDDTSACPIATACEVCHGGYELLTVVTASTSVGLVCLTLCEEHVDGPPPRLALGDALHRAMAHCEHVDADLDEIAAAVAAKDAR